ncbi:Uncharacterised protein [Candidatus Bilamarchaeum dharawalense]|uniref:CARDB domain-containing protein n=1 Tax=Candidatus Bilamarchaeum dharawalense TaxID=2885759 RepID=A0A5E4LSC0_9ARCH|nr:Uncharacterised protein [Candidatus Bilamarchaeum dharawalense]
MGLLDSILGKTSDEPPPKATANPFNVSIAFAPLRLSAHNRSSVNLIVKVKNISRSPQMISVDALLQKGAMLGFDPACINKAAEKRVGELQPGDTTEAQITLWSNSQTKPGSYSVEVSVYSHYISYDKVLNYIKKSTTIRAV